MTANAHDPLASSRVARLTDLKPRPNRFVAFWSLLRRSPAPGRSLRRIRSVTSLALLFFYELCVSAVRVAIVVLTPDMKSVLRPALIAFPLSVRSDAEITLLANLITLTPGTLSVDVSDDRSLLYVHTLTLDTREALIADIAGGFEAKVREVFA